MPDLSSPNLVPDLSGPDDERVGIVVEHAAQPRSRGQKQQDEHPADRRHGAITQERTPAIRTQRPDGWGAKPKMGYFLTVLEDLVGQALPATGTADD